LWGVAHACSLFLHVLEVPDLDFLKPADLPPTTAIQDLWHDAKMVEVLQYLYGNQNLSLPDDFKSLFPPELWAWA